MNSWNGNEQNLLFTNLGDTNFSDVARPLGCDEIEESRGVAIADLDKDGRLDIVINNNDAAPTIYLNRLVTETGYFRCTLQGDPTITKSGLTTTRDALGTRVDVDVVENGSKRTLLRHVEAGSGFAAQSESTLHFGLGHAERIEELRIAWPNGELQTINALVGDRLNREWVIQQGKPPVEARIARLEWQEDKALP